MNRPFLDSNVLVYSAIRDDPRVPVAVSLLSAGGRIGVQVLAEFTSVVRGKLRMPWSDVERAVAAILQSCPDPVPLNVGVCADARRIAERYGYNIYDSQIIAAALAANSRDLLSEDMQHGQVIDGRLTIRNPFA